jgi:hypothetical protein
MEIHEVDLDQMAAYCRRQLFISKVKKAIVVTSIGIFAVVMAIGVLAVAGVIDTKPEEPKIQEEVVSTEELPTEM